MAWLRIDDRARTHPKIIKAGSSAAWLWFCGLSYCREHLTDGKIDKKAIKILTSDLTFPQKFAKKLVEVGLWHDRGSYYEVHDFLDWNPSKEQVIAQRNGDSARKRSVSSDRIPDGIQPDSDRIPDGIPPDSSRARAGVRARARDKELDLALSEDKSAREETKALVPVQANGWVVPHGNPHGNPLNLVNGADARSHGSHAWCAPGRPSLCVLQKQHSEIMGALQRSDAETRVFYARALAKYDGQPIGDNRFKFWENEIAAEVGTVTSSPPQFQTKGNGTAAAFNRFAAAVKAGRV